METPPPNDSFQASLSPPVGPHSVLRSFRRDWLTNKCSSNVLNIITSGYVLPFISKPNLVRAPLIRSGYKALQKELALTSCIQSLVFYRLVSCTQASPKVEASNRPKQTQHLPTEGEWVSSIDLSDARLHIPIHPIPKVLPQVASFSVHFPSLQTSHGPSGLYNDCKRGEADGPVKGNQTSPVTGRLADQGSVSGRSTSKHSDSGGPNSVLRVDNKSGEVQTKTYSSVFVRGLRIPSRFSPCKTHSREMAQTSGFDPTTQVKTCFDCKMFDVTNWVACLNGENGPGATPSHETLSV